MCVIIEKNIIIYRPLLLRHSIALVWIEAVVDTVEVGAADKGAAFEGAKVPEQGPMTSQACCHAPPYTVENGSYQTWLHS